MELKIFCPWACGTNDGAGHVSDRHTGMAIWLDKQASDCLLCSGAISMSSQSYERC